MQRRERVLQATPGGGAVSYERVTPVSYERGTPVSYERGTPGARRALEEMQRREKVLQTERDTQVRPPHPYLAVSVA